MFKRKNNLETNVNQTVRIHWQIEIKSQLVEAESGTENQKQCKRDIREGLRKWNKLKHKHVLENKNTGDTLFYICAKREL